VGNMKYYNEHSNELHRNPWLYDWPSILNSFSVGGQFMSSSD
jgi:hypothetical protein